MRGVTGFFCWVTIAAVGMSAPNALGAAPGFTYGAGGTSKNRTVVVSSSNASNTTVGSALNPDVVTPGFIGRTQTEPSTTSSAFVFSGVNTATGNYHQSTLDLLIPGEGFPFAFRRYYNSLDPYNGPLGRGWTHSYNIRLTISGQNVTLKDADGVEIPYTFSGGGKYSPSIPGVYDTLTVRPDGRFLLTSRNQTVLTFSPAGLLASIEDHAGNLQRLAYNGNSTLKSVTDTNGRVFDFSYNGSNRLISILDTVGGSILRYSYNGAGDLVSYKDPFDSETRYAYDANHRLKTVTDALNKSVVQNTYDAQGRVKSQKDASGATTALSYLATETVITDPRGNKVRHQYSDFLLTAIIDQLARKTAFTYDANRNILTAKDPSGTTKFTYDLRGNITSVTDPSNSKTTFTYDALNNLLTVKDGLGKITGFTYDAENNRTGSVNAQGNQTSSAYDSQGNLAQVTDANGNVTKYVYDANGNLATVTDALGNITRYTYDADGNKKTFINANGKTTTYEYDVYRRLISVTDPLLNKTVFAYDAAGNLKSILDANGSLTQFTSDAQGRRTKIAYTGGEIVTFTYDGIGNRASMTDSTGTTTYKFDKANHLALVTFPGGKQVGYSYDSDGNLKSLTYPDNKVVTYLYDAAGRLTKVTDWASRLTTYQYDLAGRLIQIDYPGATTVKLAYDNTGRLIQVQNVFPEDGVAPGRRISKFTYVLDAVGNRTKITDGNGNVTSLTYDKLNQLKSYTTGGITTQYAYDAVGNRKTLTAPGQSIAYTYDDADRLMKAGDIIFEFDANGSMTKMDTIPVTFKYKYDGANRLIEVLKGSVKTTFTYDGDGVRVGQRTGGSIYEYINDVSTPLVAVLAESGPDGQISYVRGPKLTSASGAVPDFFYLFNGQFSVVGLTDAGGHLLQNYDYAPFGAPVSTPGPNIGSKNKFRYIGEALDPATDLYYLRTRYYNPDLGRLLTKDAFLGFEETPLTQNLYVYSRNNPLRFTDPTGLVACDLNDPTTWPCAPPLDYPPPEPPPPSTTSRGVTNGGRSGR